MSRSHYYILSIFLFLTTNVYSQYPVAGKVLDQHSKAPVPYATIYIEEQELWTISNQDGAFFLADLKPGKITIAVSCLGYAKYAEVFTNASAVPQNYNVYLKPNNLTLSEVVVTAKKTANKLTTSYEIDRNSMNHIQATSVTDIMSQLPGNSTSNIQALTTPQTIGIKEESSDLDNSEFGTAIEIDGIRLSNNGNFVNETGSYDGINGTKINNISIGNIESVEVVTGLPSVEYGDLTSGLIAIKTKKGRTPYAAEVILKPKIKSYSLQKGFDLGKNKGTLNVYLEHTRSFSHRVSPYTTYKRNNISLTYNNEYHLWGKPLIINSTIAGNIGGYNSEADPDLFVDTYEKESDNTLRGALNFKYLLNLPWITGLDFKVSANYSQKENKEKSKEESSSSTALIRSTETGYYIGVDYADDPDAAIVVVEASDADGWYQTRIVDNQPINYAMALKANWSKNFGNVINNVKIGGEYDCSGNYGRGEYYADMKYTDTDYREYRYDEQPFTNNIALFAEDRISLPVYEREMEIQGGLRYDMTYIRNSIYGLVSSLSPRLNLKYTLIANNDGPIRNMMLHAAFGDAVKLPSANILNPRPSYSDKLVFSGKSDSETNTSYPAYYTYVSNALYNPDLKYQRVRKTEIGIDFRTNFATFSVTGYHNKTYHPYKKTSKYSAYTYKYTDNSALENCEIPYDDQSYSIDNTTGIITVSDETGEYSSEALNYSEKTSYVSNTFYTNGSSRVVKKGLDWIIKFNKIKALNTSIRIDGTYAYYKGVDETLEEDLPYSGTGSDGENYKYIAYYIGGDSYANGQVTKKLKTNFTLITHIPKIRLIMTLRIEACLHNSMQRLSQYSNGRRSYVLADEDDYVGTASNIYAGDQYIALYPLYYSSSEDGNTTLYDFYEKFIWASENDADLYSDLTKMVNKTSYSYYFNKRKYSPYFSANLNITKEISDKISISFLANNFLNNMAQIENSQTGNKVSLYQSGYIPDLYYGLSLRVKL